MVVFGCEGDKCDTVISVTVRSIGRRFLPSQAWRSGTGCGTLVTGFPKLSLQRLSSAGENPQSRNVPSRRNLKALRVVARRCGGGFFTCNGVKTRSRRTLSFTVSATGVCYPATVWVAFNRAGGKVRDGAIVSPKPTFFARRDHRFHHPSPHGAGEIPVAVNLYSLLFRLLP